VFAAPIHVFDQPLRHVVTSQGTIIENVNALSRAALRCA
jgi:hypothetical protein